MIKQAVILCGGLGTRLLPITQKIPKPMVIIDRKPFLEHLIIQCKTNGIKNILLLCGYKSEIIKKYFKNGKKFGVKIKYHFNPVEIETLKRLIDAKKLLNQKFLLLYGDNYSSLNLDHLKKVYKKSKCQIILTICKKNPGNILINKKKNKIKKYFLKKMKSSNLVEIGYSIFDKRVFSKINKNKNISLSYFLKINTLQNKISYYFNDTNYLSISDIKRLEITKRILSNKVILLDRDGVMNKKNKKHRYVRNLSDLEINDEFLKNYYKLLKNKKIICITNQAGIATGDLNNKNLKEINNKIKKEYKKNGLLVVDFFISKHHFTSKNIERKPGHGLFLKAAMKHNFALDKTTYIGDDLRDIQAAYNAKTKCIYIGKEKIPKKTLKKFAHTINT